MSVSACLCARVCERERECVCCFCVCVCLYIRYLLVCVCAGFRVQNGWGGWVGGWVGWGWSGAWVDVLWNRSEPESPKSCSLRATLKLWPTATITVLKEPHAGAKSKRIYLSVDLSIYSSINHSCPSTIMYAEWFYTFVMHMLFLF